MWPKYPMNGMQRMIPVWTSSLPRIALLMLVCGTRRECQFVIPFPITILEPSSSSQQVTHSLILNSEATDRMPEVVIQTNSLSASNGVGQTSAGLLAIQPQMRILKRPSTPSSGPATAASPSPSIQEREASYAAARERIFRSDSSSPAPLPSSTNQPNTGQSMPARARTSPDGSVQDVGPTQSATRNAEVRILRDPIGSTTDDRGFRTRSSPKKSRHQSRPSDI